jgi:PEP-CTERM motif-containing protein
LSLKSWFSIPLLALGFSSLHCLGSTIGLPDISCNPAVETPAASGCTWYNFYSLTDGTITGGSSFTNYYVPSLDPPWTITTTVATNLRVLDGGHEGDTFSVFDNGKKIGTTSSAVIDAIHSCAGDTTGQGTDPAACWNDSLMSRGIFLLAPGSHSLTITWDQRVPGGNSSLQWFEIGNAPATSGVPEPSAVLLMGSGVLLIGFGAVRRKTAC